MWLLLADELGLLFLISESYNLENNHTFSLFVQIQKDTMHFIHDATRNEMLQTSRGILTSFAGERKIRWFCENGHENCEVFIERMFLPWKDWNLEISGVSPQLECPFGGEEVGEVGVGRGHHLSNLFPGSGKKANLGLGKSRFLLAAKYTP